MRGAGLRLHGRVRQKRHLIIGFHPPNGACHSGNHVAVGTPDLRLFRGQAARTASAIAAFESALLPPLFHSIGNASSARLARHQEFATTATPSGIRTTRRTPFIEAIAFSLTAFSDPPNTGQWTMAA